MRSTPPPNTVSWMVASEVTTSVSIMRSRASWASFSITLSADCPAGEKTTSTPPTLVRLPWESSLSPASNTMTAPMSRPAKFTTSLMSRSRAVLKKSSV
jgi:hypothetical protein